MKILFLLAAMLVTLTSTIREKDQDNVSRNVAIEQANYGFSEIYESLKPIETAYAEVGQYSVDNRTAIVKTGQALNYVVAGKIVKQQYFDMFTTNKLFAAFVPLSVHDGVYNGIDCTAGESDNYCCYYGATTVFCVKKEKGIK